MSLPVYMCLNTDSMVCTVDLPLDHAFSVFNHELSRQWGFHPHVPQALRDGGKTSTRAAV